VLVNDVSPDGRWILYMDFARGMPDLRELDVHSRATRSAIDNAAEATYSPDGRWIAFVGATQTGISIVGREKGERIRISQGHGSQARWRRDMTEMFYIGMDRKLMSVALTRRDGTLVPSAPVPLFQTRIMAPTLVLWQYAATADGQRFLINSLPREDAAAPITLVTNWRGIDR
jgi:hypothetical protein